VSDFNQSAKSCTPDLVKLFESGAAIARKEWITNAFRAMVSESAYFAIHSHLRIIDLDLQHREAPLQIPSAALYTVSRLKFSLHATIDYDRIAARR